jgi:two-component system, OmpR family, alkaline phosphatase synthesis response regulator PhoP
MTQSILLCDDEIAVLRAAEFKLRRAGYEVRCADDGQEAWEEIERQIPDLLVTDLQMPRLDGFGLCRRVRANPATRHLPIVMLTAKGFELTMSTAAEESGIYAIMPKPFSPRELLETIQRALAEQSNAQRSDAEHSDAERNDAAHSIAGKSE